MLKEKIILVTGGSGLLGHSIVKGISEEGGIAISADINLNEIQDNTHIHLDITDQQSINHVIDGIVEKFGRLDGLVNSAYPKTKDWGKKFEDIEVSSWKTNVDIQLNSTFATCQSVLKHMKKQGSGSIVNIASIYGVVGPDFSVYDGTNITMPAAYSAVKGGIINFTRYLAAYYGPGNIRVNCISPGGIFDNQPEQFVQQYSQKVPLRRMGTSADITPAVCFLLSDQSSYITGHNLMIDGGWTAV